jgi:excisionase family DNA binding protein
LPWWDPDQPVTPEIRRGLRRMLHDDAVKPALLTKLFSVSSLDWQFQAADPEDPRSRLVSDFSLYAARHMDGGTRALVEEILFPGLIDGLSVCEVVLREEPEPFGRWAGKEMVRCLKAKEHAWPEEDRYGNTTGIYAQTELGFTTLPPERFVIFKYLPLFGRPHSDLQAAYRLYVARDALMKLWLIGVERWGQPFLKGTYAAGDEQAKNELAASLGAVKGRTWVVHPDGTMIDFVDAAFSGSAAHEACWQKLTEGIYLSINGAFLQSLTSGTQHVSQRGNSQTQKSTFELFVWHLAAVIADATNEKLWPLVTSRNFAAAAPPQATLAGVNDSDLKASADLDDVLLNKLGLGMSRKDRAAFYGRQLASTPDDALTPAKPAGPPAPPLSPAVPPDATPFADPPADDPGPLLTVREAAQRLRLSPGTVRRLCEAGGLEHRRPAGRYRVTERGLLAYLSGTVSPPG